MTVTATKLLRVIQNGRRSKLSDTVLNFLKLHKYWAYLERQDLFVYAVVGDSLTVQYHRCGAGLQQLGEHGHDVWVLVRVVLAVAAVDCHLSACDEVERPLIL